MKFSSVTAAGAVFGLAAANPISKRSAIHKRQVPQEQSHGFILNIANEFMKLENTLNIQDAVFGLLGNAAAQEGAGAVTNLDCLKQATADQAFTNAKAAGDIRGMAGALMFQAIERNTGKVGLASVLCNETTANPEVGALISHQDAASENALAMNKAITLELSRQLAGIGADPNLALLTGTFPPGDVNDNTGAGLTCDTVDLELGCIYTEKLLVLDATEDEIASAVAGVQQTFTGTGGIFATDIVNLADFKVAEVTGSFDLAAVAPGSGAAATGGGAGAVATETPAAQTPGVTETPAVTETAKATATDECEVATTTAARGRGGGRGGRGGDRGNGRGNGRGRGGVTAQCSLVTLTVGADQTSAVMAQYPSAVVTDIATPGEGVAATTTVDITPEATATEAAGNAGNNNENAGGAAGGAAAGNLQTFSGALGGAAPPVVNSGNADRPFQVNGATFTNEAAALVRSCDIQNNQCFNAVNGGELTGGTAQCAQQLDQCRANAGSAQRARRSNILGNSNPQTLAGGRDAVAGPAAGGPRAGARPAADGPGAGGRGAGGRGNRAGAAKNVAIIGGGAAGVGIIGGANGGIGQLLGGGLNLGNLLGGGNIAQLLGGGIVGAVPGLNQVIQPSRGNQQLVSLVFQQCQ